MPILSSRKESKQLVFILNRIGSYCLPTTCSLCHQLVTSKKQCMEISLGDFHLLPCVWQRQVNCTSGSRYIPRVKMLKDLNHVVIVVLSFQKNSKRNLKVEQTRLWKWQTYLIWLLSHVSSEKHWGMCWTTTSEKSLQKNGMAWQVCNQYKGFKVCIICSSSTMDSISSTGASGSTHSGSSDKNDASMWSCTAYRWK